MAAYNVKKAAKPKTAAKVIAFCYSFYLHFSWCERVLIYEF